jgi:type IV secretion system protein VirD4
MVSRQETARPLLTPGEVMQLPARDELVLVAGMPPIRARKLRYYEDRSFAERLLAPPVLADDGYADVPAPRGDDWAEQAAGFDARLAAGADDLQENASAGRERARQSEIELTAPAPEPAASADPLGLDEDMGDPAADSRAMDEALGLGAVRAAYAIDADARRGPDLVLEN